MALTSTVRVTASTERCPVNVGQSYSLPADMSNGMANNDPSAPSNGFYFINHVDGAAAVVYKQVAGSFAPMYISQYSPLPKGTSTLIPKLQVQVWLERSGETGTMIWKFSGPPCEIDLTDNQSHKAACQYNASGDWNITSNS